jgi:hypothetical protein
MRHIRVLATAAVLAAVISQPSAAQSGRQFKDAWFWGVRGGFTGYSSTSTDNAVAPMLGIDWLITRSRGGLYVGFDQTFLTTDAFFTSPGASGFTDPRVTISGQRRLTVAGMMFPMQSPTLHPYFGVGMSINKIGGSTYNTTPTNPSAAQISLAEDSVQARRAAIAPTIIVGVQKRLIPFSVFGQITATFLNSGYFLRSDNASRPFGYSLEGGIRYNVGSSIDQVR